LLQKEFVAPFEGAPANRTFTTGRPAVLGRSDLEGLGSKATRVLMDERIQSQCSLSLVSRGRTLGTLDVGPPADAAFTDHEVELLNQVGG
jgi:hypothetical protein